MILINLLPHRELARKRARQLFNAAMIAAVAAGLLIAGAIFTWYKAEISTQQSRNQFLTSEIKKLEAEIKEVENLQEEIAALRARQEAVENLQADRLLQFIFIFCAQALFLLSLVLEIRIDMSQPKSPQPPDNCGCNNQQKQEFWNNWPARWVAGIKIAELPA